MAITAVTPDSRGRLALGGLVQRDRSYTASEGLHGEIILTPIAAVLSDEQISDMTADPVGFAEMMKRAATVNSGSVEGVPVDAIFDEDD